MYPQIEEMNLELIAALVQYICKKHGYGAILVFLPGWDNISKLYNKLADNSFFSSGKFLLILLSFLSFLLAFNFSLMCSIIHSKVQDSSTSLCYANCQSKRNLHSTT
jgi:HrpA-like RNA helicase